MIFLETGNYLLSLVRPLYQKAQQDVKEAEEQSVKGVAPKSLIKQEGFWRDIYNNLCLKNYLAGVWSLAKPSFFLGYRNIIFNNHLKDYLPIANGKKICLRDLSISKRVPTDYFTRSLNVNYIPFEDNCPKIKAVEQYFLDICCQDAEFSHWLELVCATFLTGSNQDRFFYVWYGTGRNSKSVLARILTNILGGDNINCNISEKFVANLPEGALLKVNNRNPSQHSSHLQDIIYSRLMISNESNENPVLNDVVLKGITGDDAISIRKIWSSFNTTFYPCCKVLMISNHKPYLNFYDKAFADRMKLVPFKQRFEDTPANDKKVKDLQDNLDIFFSHLVRKAKEYYSNPIQVRQIPNVVRHATQDILQDNDYLGEFIKEHFVYEIDYIQARRQNTWKNIMKKNLAHTKEFYDSNLANTGLYWKVFYQFYTKHFKRPLSKNELFDKLKQIEFSQTVSNYNILLYKKHHIAFKSVLSKEEILQPEYEDIDLNNEEVLEVLSSAVELELANRNMSSYQQELERIEKQREKDRRGKEPKEYPTRRQRDDETDDD